MTYKEQKALREEYIRNGGQLYTIETAPRTHVESVEEFLKQHGCITHEEFVKRITSLID